MVVVVCYDIPDNRRRGRLSKMLEGYGTRTQRSVFECDVTATQFARLQERMKRLVKTPEDKIRCYVLCEACLPRTVIIGPGKVHRAPTYYII